VFAGLHTVSDLGDLVRAIDYERGELEAFPSPSDSWARELAATGAKYAAWRPGALAMISRTVDRAQIYEPVWGAWWAQAVSFVRDYRELDRALRMQTGGRGPEYAHMPQPTRADFDLEAYKFSLWATSPGTWLSGLRDLVLLYVGYTWLQSRAAASSPSSASRSRSRRR
jgi:hypothetical protein